MISVIIPVYNRAHVIKRAIESVLSQTFNDFELIIVNDCSTDNSIEIIEGFKDERIRCFQTSKNMGAAAARNLGIKNSRGSIISFLDSDDYYEPEILKISYDLLSKSRNETGFMWTGCRNYVNNKNFEFCWEPLYNESFYITFLTSLHIGTNSGISVKKSVFEKCGYFSETLPAAEDTDFFLRITQHYGYVFSKKILINIDKKGQDRLSKDFKKIAIAYNIFIKYHFSEIDKKEVLQKKYYYKLMWLNYHLGDNLTADKYYEKLKKIKNIGMKVFLIHFIFKLFPFKIAVNLHKLMSR